MENMAETALRAAIMTVRKGVQVRSPEVRAFGYNFREARRKAGLSMKDVSEKTGTVISYLSKMERGQTGISMDKAAELAHVIGVPLAKLLKYSPAVDEPRTSLPPARMAGKKAPSPAAKKPRPPAKT